MTNIWLVRAITGRVRVKWLDEEGDVCEWECDDEKAARAFGGSLLKFRPDMETSLLMAGQLVKENPEMSPEEAMERVGIAEVEFTPRIAAKTE